MVLVWVILGLFGAVGVFLALATALLPAKREALQSLWKAWREEFLLLGFVFVPAYFGGWAWFLAVTLLACGCVLDLSQLRPARLLERPAPPPAAGRVQGAIVVAACALVFVLGFRAGPSGLPLVSAAVGAGLLLAGLSRSAWRASWARGLPSAGLALVYPALPLLALLWIGLGAEGFASLVFMLGVAEVHDSGCMIVGKLVGGPKSFPRLSPNKTWAGSAGGVVLGLTTAAGLAPCMPHLDLRLALLGGGVVIAAAIAGDLFASKLKRLAGVKDFPRPTRVPWLESYDALACVAPAFWLFLGLARGA